MEPTFRVAQVTDLDTVLVFMQELFLEDRLPDQCAFDSFRARSALKDLVTDPSRGIVWLICDGDAAVSYLVLTFGYSLEFHGRDAFIDEVYIRPTHRSRGWALSRWDMPKLLQSQKTYGPSIWKSVVETYPHRHSTEKRDTRIMTDT